MLSGSHARVGSFLRAIPDCVGGCRWCCAVMQHPVACRDIQRLRAGPPEGDPIGKFR